jgi:hypothetical protein
MFRTNADSDQPGWNAAQNRKAVEELEQRWGFGRSLPTRTRLMIVRLMVSCSQTAFSRFAFFTEPILEGSKGST